MPDDGETPPSGLTEEHHSWIEQFLGTSARRDASTANTVAAQAGPPPAAAAPGAAKEESVGVWGAIKGAAASVGDALSEAKDGAGKVVDAVTHGNPSLSDVGWMAAGGAAHIAAGLVPGGVIGAGAIDGLVAAKGSQEQKFWYGVGTTAAGVADTAVGGGMIAGGGLLAPETGGVTLVASAEGVNAVAAGVEAMAAGALLMAGGPGDGNGGGSKGETEEERDRRRREEYEKKHGDEDDEGADKSGKMQTGTKSELENSGWLKDRLPDTANRRAFMKDLEKNHQKVDPKTKRHIHYEPGAPDTLERLQQWANENQVVLAKDHVPYIPVQPGP